MLRLAHRKGNYKIIFFNRERKIRSISIQLRGVESRTGCMRGKGEDWGTGLEAVSI